MIEAPRRRDGFSLTRNEPNLGACGQESYLSHRFPRSRTVALEGGGAGRAARWALAGGEDYELIAAVPRSAKAQR